MVIMDFYNSTITITFGDQAENHVGMQKLGSLSERGFSLKELMRAKRRFERMGAKCKLIDLVEASGVGKIIRKYNKEVDRHNEGDERNNEEVDDSESKEAPKPHIASPEDAYVLVIRKGVNYILGENSDSDTQKALTALDLFTELSNLPVDKKALMKGKVVNKKARYNLCFAAKAQEPDYAKGKGTVVRFKDLNILNTIRKALPDYICKRDDEWHDLVAEGNFYYNTDECGIGYHGDSERRRVIALRLGKTMNIVYQWYVKSERVGNKVEVPLGHGDVYIMSEKAVGFDWKKRKSGKELLPTLRHAAGCDKYTQ